MPSAGVLMVFFRFLYGFNKIKEEPFFVLLQTQGYAGEPKTLLISRNLIKNTHILKKSNIIA